MDDYSNFLDYATKQAKKTSQEKARTTTNSVFKSLTYQLTVWQLGLDAIKVE